MSLLYSKVTASQISHCLESKEADQARAEGSEVGKVSFSWGEGPRRGAEPGKENNKKALMKTFIIFLER